MHFENIRLFSARAFFDHFFTRDEGWPGTYYLCHSDALKSLIIDKSIHRCLYVNFRDN